MTDIPYNTTFGGDRVVTYKELCRLRHIMAEGALRHTCGSARMNCAQTDEWIKRNLHEDQRVISEGGRTKMMMSNVLHHMNNKGFSVIRTEQLQPDQIDYARSIEEPC